MIWPALLLLALAILTRLAPLANATFWPTHFAAVTAVALCGGALLRRPQACLLAVLALFSSDLLLNLHFGTSLFDWTMIPRYAILGATAFWGAHLARRNQTLRLRFLLPASLAATAVFYLVTNASCWVTDPGYPGTFSGLIQALTVGLPGYPPTWTFLRNSLIGDSLFTVLFYVSLKLGERVQPHRMPASAPAQT